MNMQRRSFSLSSVSLCSPVPSPLSLSFVIPALLAVSLSFSVAHSHQHWRALRLDHPREPRLVLLARDERVHQEPQADPGDEEVVQDAIDAMPLDKANLAPVVGWRKLGGIYTGRQNRARLNTRPQRATRVFEHSIEGEQKKAPKRSRSSCNRLTHRRYQQNGECS